MMDTCRWNKLSVEEIQALLEKHGLQYDFTVASSQKLADLLDSEVVRERFMDLLVERVRTQPMTNLQYRLLGEVAELCLPAHVAEKQK